LPDADEISEFMPYVFQLFAAMLEVEPTKPLPQPFHSLIGPIIAPPIWEQRGNVPALVRLLTAIIPRAAEDLVKSNQLEGVLGLFQKLVSTKVYEGYGFDLLECVVENYPPSTLEPYWIHVFTIMLTRLQSQQSTGFHVRFVRFYHFIASRDDKGLGTDFLVAATDKVQHDVFKGIYLSIILPKTQQLARPLDRKIAAVSFTKLLADSEAFVNRYPKGWPHTCNALLKLLEAPPVPPKGEDIIADHDVDDSSFGVGFTQLQTIKRPVNDPWREVTDLRKWVGQYLQAADRRHAGRVGNFVNEGLSEDAKTVLSTYMHL
jgi:exportin-2 (importin alpha re-exporter)